MSVHILFHSPCLWRWTCSPFRNLSRVSPCSFALIWGRLGHIWHECALQQRNMVSFHSLPTNIGPLSFSLSSDKDCISNTGRIRFSTQCVAVLLFDALAFSSCISSSKVLASHRIWCRTCSTTIFRALVFWGKFLPVFVTPLKAAFISSSSPLPAIRTPCHQNPQPSEPPAIRTPSHQNPQPSKTPAIRTPTAPTYSSKSAFPQDEGWSPHQKVLGKPTVHWDPQDRVEDLQ